MSCMWSEVIYRTIHSVTTDPETRGYICVHDIYYRFLITELITIDNRDWIIVATTKSNPYNWKEKVDGGLDQGKYCTRDCKYHLSISLAIVHKADDMEVKTAIENVAIRMLHSKRTKTIDS